MKTVINTSQKVIESFDYLENELKKCNLNVPTAILYFKILLSKEDNEVIERPYFTFALEDFKKYINFFKRYNFLDRGSNINTFYLNPDKNWNNGRVIYTVPSAFQDDFLLALENHKELNNYLRTSE